MILQKVKYILIRLSPYAILLIFSGALYWKSLGFEFIPTWDDSNYVLDNPYIRGLDLENIKEIFTRTFLGNYAPVQIMSYAIDYGIWGLSSKGYHLSNIILHGLNACGAYAVVDRITRHKGVAFMASLLFVVHPLNIENVAWIAERKSLLATLFFFCAIICYMNFRDDGSLKVYSFSIILFVLAILSRATVVTLPLVLVAYELLIKHDERGWLHLLPFFAVSIIGIALAVWTHLNAGSIEADVITINNLLGIIYPTMLTVFWKYIGLIFWPFNLSGYYDTTLYRSFLEFPVIISLTAWLLVFIIVFLKGSSQVRFWFLWFWICLLPVSNIIPIPVYYADRYMYAPGIAFFVLAGLATSKLAGDIEEESRKTGTKISLTRICPSKRMLLCYSAFALIVIFYSVIAYNRMDVWRNELVFWEDTAKKSPNLYKVRLNLGVAYEKRWRFADAEREYLSAIAIFPGEKATFNLRMVRTKMDLMNKMNK